MITSHMLAESHIQWLARAPYINFISCMTYYLINFSVNIIRHCLESDVYIFSTVNICLNSCLLDTYQNIFEEFNDKTVQGIILQRDRVKRRGEYPWVRVTETKALEVGFKALKDS